MRYWNNIGDLELVLKDEIMADLANDTQCKVEPNNICDAWVLALKGDADYRDVSYLQVLSPFRGEYFGVDYLNVFYQELLNSKQAKRKTLDGIALYDKILQYRNRPKSDKISAYSWTDRKPVKIEIYNGEIGFAVPHPLDKSLNKCFCGKYSRLNDFNINYGYKAYDDGKVMFNEPIEENLELGYVISIHKAQGSEFNRVYLILPKRNSRLLSMELMYTAITRAKHHLTIFAQTDVSTFIELSQIGKSSINRINSSVFNFSPLPDELFKVNLNWYEDEKIISTLSQYFVRSKSEMNIANILALNNIRFEYELPLFAPDGSMFLPDFTIHWQGEFYYWEHVGRLDIPEYRDHWSSKKMWYEEHFPGKLIVTYETNNQTKEIERIIAQKFVV